MTHLEGKWGKCSIKTELKMGCNIIVAFAPIWILISESIEIIKVMVGHKTGSNWNDFEGHTF